MKNKQNWPNLDFAEIQNTLETLHQWIQIVGKIRLKTMPWQNHSWHAALYITTSGFSTHCIPYEGSAFQIDFDFRKHKLYLSCSDTESSEMELHTRTVADFYAELLEKLSANGINVKIFARPNEIEPAIPFAENTVNKVYIPNVANTIWRAMLKSNNVFYQFRSHFIGKASPVHLFWGAFDLAVTRFSGNSAPLHQGSIPNIPLDVMQEAYSQEVSSAGFWPGSKDFPTPVFYSYAYPSGAGFGEQKVLPQQAFYSSEMGEFLLKYDDVKNSENPDKTLYDFLQSTYEAAVNTANWNGKKLEKQA